MTRWQWFKFWSWPPYRWKARLFLAFYEGQKWWLEAVWFPHKVRQNARWVRDGDPRGNRFRYVYVPLRDEE
jgi:hypothetical protein